MTTIPIPAELSGWKHENVPYIPPRSGNDLTDYALSKRRTISMYGIPGHPTYLFRRHSLRVMEITSPKHALDLISAGLHHYRRLEQVGIHVPPHRHVDAQMPEAFTAKEGRILSVVPRLPLTRLDPRNPNHLPASLHTLQGLTRYLIGLLDEGHPDFLWDIFHAAQYGLQGPSQHEAAPTPQGVVLHDFGLEMTPLHATGGGLYTARDKCAMGFAQLHAFARAAETTSLGTAYEQSARELGVLIRGQIPSVR